MSEFMQLLIGMSISRYLPANGTAGFALIFVNGYRRDPFPPPRIMASTLFMKALSIDLFGANLLDRVLINPAKSDYVVRISEESTNISCF